MFFKHYVCPSVRMGYMNGKEEEEVDDDTATQRY